MTNEQLSREDLDELCEAIKTYNREFKEPRFQIGSGWYTYAEIKALEQKYFPGFLQMNPHYPAPGIYRGLDGSASFPGPLSPVQSFAPTIPEEPVMINGFLWDKVEYADEEENAP